jgi:hypothetical protein
MQDVLFDEIVDEIEELPSTEDVFVYVLYAEGTSWIKIGYAVDVDERIRQLQTGCPPPLRLLFATPAKNAPALEQLLHDHFAPYHLHGEWFTLPPDIPTVLDLLAFVYKHTLPMPMLDSSPRWTKGIGTMEERVLDALASKEYWGIRELLRALGLSNERYGYVRHILAVLYQRGAVAKFGYGKYCLPSILREEEIQ